MLKKLHICNFQSHKQTTIDFTQGLNVIIGQSDGGKSSIIRAISAVCYNTWDSDSMRVGETCCKITLETDKGIVTLTKDTKNKINSYSGIKFQNNEQFLFESVGVSVPQIVDEITGMAPLKIADSAVDIPNIMYQLDKHYMLAEVSGKSCTSNLIARIFDKVIGLGGMQELISQISSSMINDKKQITKKMSQSDQLKNQLIDQLVLLQQQLDIKSAKKIKKQIQQSQIDLDKIDFYVQRYNSLKNNFNNIDSKYIDLDVQQAKRIIQDLVQLNKKITNVEIICDKISNLKKELQQCNNIVEKYSLLNTDDIQFIKQTCNKLYIANKVCQKYNSFNEQLKNISSTIERYCQLGLANDLLQNSKQLCNAFYKADKTISKYNVKLGQLNVVCLEIQNQTKSYQQSKNKLQKIKKQNKICPLCGNSFQKCLQEF